MDFSIAIEKVTYLMGLNPLKPGLVLQASHFAALCIKMLARDTT